MSIKLPCRVAFVSGKRGEFAPVGTPGTAGDGGWTVYDVPSREDALEFMRRYPGARMPCWNRIERGEWS